VDVFITDYRVDQAQKIVTKQDTDVFFGADDISSDGRILTLHGMQGGRHELWEHELGVAIFPDSISGFDAPAAIGSSTGPSTQPPSASAFFGSYLFFDREARHALWLFDLTLTSEPEFSVGFLLSISGTFALSDESAVQREIVSTIPDPRFKLGINEQGQLVFSVSIEADNPEEATELSLKAPITAGSGCQSKNGAFEGTFRPNEPHWIVAAYQAESISLFIDGKCGGEQKFGGIGFPVSKAYARGVALGSMQRPFRGGVQQVAQLRWPPGRAIFDSEN
jgi:hypothetical protein